MTDFKDIEQRAKDIIERCRREKAQQEHAELADKVFREPERRAIQKSNREKEDAERLKQMENMWNPYLEKAMQRVEQEKKKYDERMEKIRK